METNLTEAQETALRMLRINGSTTKSTPALRALVKKGLAVERKRFENTSIFIAVEASND